MIRFFLITVFTVVLILFGLANLHVVELNTVFSNPMRASLAFLLVGAYGAGFVSATLVGMHQALRNRQQKKEVAQSPQERPPVLPQPPQLPSFRQSSGQVVATDSEPWIQTWR